MATGANIQPGRGNVVTNLPPTVDLRTNDAEVWDAIDRRARRFDEIAKPDLIRRAERAGAAEGLAYAKGEIARPERGILFGGDVAQAREAALGVAYQSQVRGDIDAQEEALRREHRYDPEAYERAAGEMVSGFIQGADPEWAVDVETYGRSLTQRGLSAVAGAREARDEQRTVQGIGVRRAQLQERMIALAAQGKIEGSVDYLAASVEYNQLQDDSEGNPAILYSPEQRAKDDETLTIGVAGAAVGAEAIQEYTDNGGGPPGTAAATRLLRERILDGDQFSSMTPEMRSRLYRESVTNLNARSQADREERRAQAEEERVANEARRDRVGSYRFRIETGDSISEAELREDPTLEDADRAQLLRASSAAARREAAQAATDARLEAQTRRDTYLGFRDQAQAGDLTQAEIADGVQAGLISRGQGRTLGSLRDRGLRPVIDDVMAPVLDAANRPGASMRGNREALARAEENAAAWARNNPDAPLDLRLSVGRDIAARHLGAPGAGQPANRETAQTGQVAALSALSAERNRRASTGNRMSASEYDRRRNEIINGR